MEAIALVLNSLHRPKSDDVLIYLESMRVNTEILDFIDYIRLAMVNKALYRFVNNLGFRCFKLCQEDYIIYKTVIEYGDRTLFYINDILMCSRFLKLFGNSYNASVENENGKYKQKYATRTVQTKNIQSYISLRRNNEYHIMEDYITPAHIALINNNIELAKLLFDAKSIDTHYNPSVLYCDIPIDGKNIIEYLLSVGVVKTDFISRDNQNLISISAWSDLIRIYELMEYLVNNGINLHHIDRCDYIPLFYINITGVSESEQDKLFNLILSKMDLNVLYNGKNLLKYVYSMREDLEDIAGFTNKHFMIIEEAMRKHKQISSN